MRRRWGLKINRVDAGVLPERGRTLEIGIQSAQDDVERLGFQSEAFEVRSSPWHSNLTGSNQKRARWNSLRARKNDTERARFESERLEFQSEALEVSSNAMKSSLGRSKRPWAPRNPFSGAEALPRRAGTRFQGKGASPSALAAVSKGKKPPRPTSKEPESRLRHRQHAKAAGNSYSLDLKQPSPPPALPCSAHPEISTGWSRSSPDEDPEQDAGEHRGGPQRAVGKGACGLGRYSSIPDRYRRPTSLKTYACLRPIDCCRDGGVFF